jgi:hypothetical protein
MRDERKLPSVLIHRGSKQAVSSHRGCGSALAVKIQSGGDLESDRSKNEG